MKNSQTEKSWKYAINLEVKNIADRIKTAKTNKWKKNREQFEIPYTCLISILVDYSRAKAERTWIAIDYTKGDNQLFEARVEKTLEKI